MTTFGELLHTVRSRQNAAQLVKKVGISYVYLLDIEKGARPAPKESLLISLAENLEFQEDERELFFDLAAKERKSIPADVSEYIMGNQTLIKYLREIKSGRRTFEYYEKMLEEMEKMRDAE